MGDWASKTATGIARASRDIDNTGDLYFDAEKIAEMILTALREAEQRGAQGKFVDCQRYIDAESAGRQHSIDLLKNPNEAMTLTAEKALRFTWNKPAKERVLAVSRALAATLEQEKQDG